MSIEYPPGTPSWTDVSSNDTEASARFYGELFGWEVQDLGPEAGGYRNFTLGGKTVAGLGPVMEGSGPPHWTTYIAVSDVDETVSKAEASGGRAYMPPMDVLDAGRMAILADGADGAVFGLWQPKTHRGAELVNSPGSLCMNELDTRDPEGAKRFYGEVFGWEAEPIEQDGREIYAGLKLDGRLIAGLLPMDDRFPAEVPANWVSYFGVEDLDAARATAERLGGDVMVAEMEVPQGRFAVLRDPQGAPFAVFEGGYDPPPGG